MVKLNASEHKFLRLQQGLTPEQVEGLREYLAGESLFPARFIRMGINKREKPSIYQTHSMYKMPLAKRKHVRQFLPKELVDQAILEYYLDFPPGVGFLDLQTYWTNTRPAMRIVAFCLSDTAQIDCYSMVPTENVKLPPQVDKRRFGDLVVDDERTEILGANNYEYWADRTDINRQVPRTPFDFVAGEGFDMSLNLAHQVRATPEGSRWFCLGFMMGDTK